MVSDFRKGKYNLMNIYVGIDIAKHNHFATAISFNTEIIIEPFNFSSQQKNPGSLTAPGYLTLGHTVPYDTKFILLSVVSDYSITVATRPDPTVRPPSRIANVRPCSIAIGWISSMVISTLSPGMHISVPSGREITPVTSVVLK